MKQMEMCGSSSSFSCSLLWTSVDLPSTDQGCKITHTADDIWLEIFLYLPLTSIFRFKCVSKVWFSLLCNSYFINKWIERLNSIKSVPWALFYEIRSVKTHVNGGVTIPTTSYGVNSEVVSTHNGLSLKFLIPQLRETEDQLHVVGSNNSLVLLAPISHNQSRYVVCNPLTRRWFSLPPPPQTVVSCVTVSSLLCESFPSACYNVVRIPMCVTDIRNFSIDIYSSDKNDWTICEVSCPEDVLWRLGQYNKIVSHNGELLWIEWKNRIVAYNLNRNECRLINLPAEEEVSGDFSNSNECLNVSEGLICYARVRYNTTSFSLSAWVLKESWQPLQEDIQLHGFFAEVMKSRHFSGALCFDPLDKKVVIIGTGNYIWACNTQSITMEKLWERQSVFPCESDSYDMIAQPIALKLWPTLLPTPALMDNHII